MPGKEIIKAEDSGTHSTPLASAPQEAEARRSLRSRSQGHLE